MATFSQPFHRRALGMLILGLVALSSHPNLGAAVGKYTVLLEEPPVLEQILNLASLKDSSTRSLLLRDSEVQRGTLALENRQRTLAGQLQTVDPDLRVLNARQYLVNMLVVEAAESAIPRLLQIPGVRSIHPLRIRWPAVEAASEVVSAGALWDSIGGFENAGSGIKIGVIDTGIAVMHPTFSDSGIELPAGFPLGNALFTNSKVIVARSYVLPEYGLSPQPIESPEDEQGHGSAVASIAAGRPSDSSIGSVRGIAPMAFLGNYKVFGDPRLNATTTDAAIVAAVEDAVRDGMDVINLSLGGPGTFPESDPEQIAIANATRAGVVVVIAAGNTGPRAGSVNSPGTSPEAITVAAVSNSRHFNPFLEVDTQPATISDSIPIAYVPSSAPDLAEALGPLPLVTAEQAGSSDRACSELPSNSLEGVAILVQRGECNFLTKAQNLTAAGAAGMILSDTNGGAGIAMSGLSGITIPAVMIAERDGDLLRDFFSPAGSGLTVTFQPEENLAPFPRRPDLAANFSSRGPNIDFRIKPDVSAPGQDIHAASNGAGEAQFTTSLNGTSFATPIVAGAAAIFRQLHPSWSPEQIKSVLVNSADRVVQVGTRAAQVNEAGSGRLNLRRAVEAQFAVEPVSLSFRILPDSLPFEEKSLRVTNLRADSITIDIQSPGIISGVDFQISPSQISLGPFESGEVQLQASFLTAGQPRSFEGFLSLTESTGGTILTVSLWGQLVALDNTVLTVSRDGQSRFLNLNSALRSARPGNTIEIRDSMSYGPPLEISSNGSGTPLHEITIRAAPGESPFLDASGFDQPAIHIRGLRGVRLEGLRIRGLSGGLVVEDSSILMRNIFLDAEPTNSTALKMLSSRAQLIGSSIGGAETGIDLSDSQLLASDTELGSPSSPLSVGIQGAESHLFLDNTPISTLSVGLNLTGTTIILKNSSIWSVSDTNAAGAMSGWGLTALDSKVHGQGVEIVGFREGGVQIEKSNLLLSDSRVSENGTGIRATETSDLKLTRVQIFRNGQGINSTNSKLLLSDSLVTSSSGDGIQSDTTHLSIERSTLSMNAGFAVKALDSESSISRSILFGNLEGDSEGVAPEAFQNNLVHTPSLDGFQDNFLGEPAFRDPAQLDFSLLEGSEAIDMATENSRDPDLNLHDRIIDGNGDGTAQTDLGAIEFASDLGPPLFLLRLPLAPESSLGLLLFDKRTSQVPLESFFQLQPFGQGGPTTDATHFNLLPGQLASSILGQNELGDTAGWIEVQASRNNSFVSSISVLGDGRFESGFQASKESGASANMVLPRAPSGEEEQTDILVLNPNPFSTAVELTRITPTEQTTSTLHLEARSAKIATQVAQPLAAPQAKGYFRLSSDDPFAAVQAFHRGGLTTTLSGLAEGTSNRQLFSAHVIEDSVLETQLNVINTGIESTLTLRLWGNRGERLAEETRLIGSGEQWVGTVGTLLETPIPTTGWLQVESTVPGLLGSQMFRHREGQFISALPLDGHPSRDFVFPHFVSDSSIFAGLSLANPGETTAVVRLTVHDPLGLQLAETLAELPPKHRLIGVSETLLPQLGSIGMASLRVQSTGPLVALNALGRRSLESLIVSPKTILVP